MDSVSISNICIKIKTLNVTDVTELNQVIDQLNALNNFNVSAENELIEDLLCNLMNVISLDNDHLLSKFSCLLNFLVHKQKIVLQKKSLKCITKFLLSAVCSCGDWVRSDILIGLSAIIEDNVDKLEEFNDDLIGKNGVIMNLLSSDSQDKSIQYNAFRCLFNLIINPVENHVHEESLELCCQNCVLLLKSNLKYNITDVLTLKTMIISMKCLQQIFASKNLTVKNFGELLGSLKIISFYGLPGQSSMMDANLYPTLRCPETQFQQESMSESDSAHPKVRKQKKNKRKARKTPHKRQTQVVSSKEEDDDRPVIDISDGIIKASLSSSSKNFHEIKIRSSSSDSEMSDAENHISKIKALQASLRQNAYLTLQAIFKTWDRKVMFGYWSSFIPEHPIMPGIVSSQNIFTTILKDSVPQVRLTALMLLAEMLRGSKQFLLHADGRNSKHMSFTSLSSILATMISEIHRCLLLALLSENSTGILTQILKCYTALSENVPYCKLSKDMLFKFLKHIKSLIYHKDIQVQIACLAVFGSLINSDQTPAEVEELMLSLDFDSTLNTLNSNVLTKPNPSPQNVIIRSSTSPQTEINHIPWIVQLCQNNILCDEPVPLKVQYLQLMNSIVGKYFYRSLSFLSMVNDIIRFCLDSPDTTVQLHGAKLLDVVGHCMNNLKNSELIEVLKPIVSDLWQNVLSGPLIKCLSNDSHKILQSVCCDCLSALSSSDFEALPGKQHITCIAILLGLASDLNAIVRGAAIRCLGFYCLFPCLIQDISFLDDVSVILIQSVKDPSTSVRFKASWSLGNLSDALFSSREGLLMSKVISPQFLTSVGMACVEFSDDCDRVKANAVRALGNILNNIPEQFMGLSKIQEFIKLACDVLISSLTANFMKACWNSCYALRNMLKNISLIEKNILDLEKMYKSLLQVLKSPNFKVRISAAQALTALASRVYYGSLFPEIGNCLIGALFSISDDVNFKEFQHQENLRDQLCFSICQLASLVTLDDIPMISKRILEAREILLTSMWKFGLRSNDEKNITVCIAVEKINSLKTESLPSEIETVLIALLDIFNQAVIAFYEKDT